MTRPPADSTVAASAVASGLWATRRIERPPCVSVGWARASCRGGWRSPLSRAEPLAALVGLGRVDRAGVRRRRERQAHRQRDHAGLERRRAGDDAGVEVL